MVDLPNIKNYPKETKRIYLIICIFAAFLNKRLANKMKKGLFYAILASILWAIVNPFIKQGLSYDFTPMNFAGIRFTTVGIILFAYTWHKGMWREIRQHSKLFLNLILINMFMGYTAFYFGVDFVSGAISSIIMGMTPLINVLLAHLLASNDKLNTHKIISLIVSLIGLFLIIGMGSNGAPLDWKGITGIVLLLLSIISNCLLMSAKTLCTGSLYIKRFLYISNAFSVLPSIMAFIMSKTLTSSVFVNTAFISSAVTSCLSPI